jgi:hypothetical protein
MSSKDSKAYIKVKTELSKMYKPSQYQTLYNNLITVANTTEDEKLKELISKYCKGIHDVPALAERKLMQHVSDIIRCSNLDKFALLDYCDQVIASNKPEWQIIAEANNWWPRNYIQQII